MTTRHLMRRPEVCAATGLSRAQIDRLERRGEFPARRTITERAVGWRSDEVQAWIDARPCADAAPADARNLRHQRHATA